MQLSDIREIHKKRKAIFNRLYVEDSGKVFIGTIDNRLKLLTSTTEVIINDTSTLYDLLIIDGTGTKFLSDDGTYKEVVIPTHTGEVTGDTVLTVDKTAITNKTLVTALGTDYVLISDTSDSGNLKKALASDLAVVSDGDKGDITVSGVGTVWTVDNLAITDAKINDVAWSKVTGEPTTLSGYGISDTKANFDTACSDGNFLYVGDVTTNATHTGDVTGATALTIDKTAITGKTAVTAVGTDYVLISDTSDTGNLKKALVSDFGGGLTQQQVEGLI